MFGRGRVIKMVSSVFAAVLLVAVLGANVSAHSGPENIYEWWARDGVSSGLSTVFYGENPDCYGNPDTVAIGSIWLVDSNDYNIRHGGDGSIGDEIIIDVPTGAAFVPVYIYGSVYGCAGTPVSHEAKGVREYGSNYLTGLSKTTLPRNGGGLSRSNFSDTPQNQYIKANLVVNNVFTDTVTTEKDIIVKLERCMNPADRSSCGVSNIPITIRRFVLSGRSTVDGQTSVTYEKKQGETRTLNFVHTITKKGEPDANNIKTSFDVFRQVGGSTESWVSDSYGGGYMNGQKTISITGDDGATTTVYTHSYTVQPSDWGKEICSYVRYDPNSSTDTNSDRTVSSKACATLVDDTAPPDPPKTCTENSNMISWGPTTVSHSCSVTYVTKKKGADRAEVTYLAPLPAADIIVNGVVTVRKGQYRAERPYVAPIPDRDQTKTYDYNCSEEYSGSAKVSASPSPSAVDHGDQIKFIYSVDYSNTCTGQTCRDDGRGGYTCNNTCQFRSGPGSGTLYGDYASSVSFSSSTSITGTRPILAQISEAGLRPFGTGYISINGKAACSSAAKSYVRHDYKIDVEVSKYEEAAGSGNPWYAPRQGRVVFTCNAYQRGPTHIGGAFGARQDISFSGSCRPSNTSYFRDGSNPSSTARSGTDTQTFNGDAAGTPITSTIKATPGGGELNAPNYESYSYAELEYQIPYDYGLSTTISKNTGTTGDYVDPDGKAIFSYEIKRTGNTRTEPVWYSRNAYVLYAGGGSADISHLCSSQTEEAGVLYLYGTNGQTSYKPSDCSINLSTDPVADVGDRICASINAWSVPERSWPGSFRRDARADTGCVTVAKSPQINIRGSDSFSGAQYWGSNSRKVECEDGKVNAPCELPDESADDDITGRAGGFVGHANPFNNRGSWSQYGLLSNGTVQSFGSAGQTYSGSSIANACRLTFANADGSNVNCANTKLLGNFGVAGRVVSLPDAAISGMPANGKLILIEYGAGALGLVQLNVPSSLSPPGSPPHKESTATEYAPERYKRTTKATIPATAIGDYRDIILVVENDVRITGNITTASDTFSSLRQIPNLTIVANNIYIDSNVTELFGNYIANNRVYTCGADYTAGMSHTELKDGKADNSANARCGKQLTINGSLTSKNTPKLQRTYGAGRSDSTVPSEIFNYMPNAFLTPWANGTYGAGDWVTKGETVLPARF